MLPPSCRRLGMVAKGCMEGLASRIVKGVKLKAQHTHGSPKRSVSGIATRVASGRCRCWYGATRERRFNSAHRSSHSKQITSRSART